MQRYTIYRIPFFHVFLTIKNGITCLQADGLMSPILWLFMRTPLKKHLEMFHGQVPAMQSENTLFFSTWLPPIPGRVFNRLLLSYTKAFFGCATPDQVTISITEECPNRCIHCALPDTLNKAMLKPDKIEDIIHQVLDMGTTSIIFDGGEPLVYDGLEKLISYVDYKRAISTIFTSGFGMTPEKARSLKAAGLYSINVSLDSPFEDEHDRIRGRAGVFKEALNAINCAKGAGLLVDIYVVIAPHNIDHLDDFYSLALNCGVHELSMYEIVPTGRWLDHDKDVLSADDKVKLNEFKERYEQYGNDVKDNTIDSDTKRVRFFSIPHTMEITGCFAGRKWIHVTPQGDVLPCACIPLPYGNVNTEPIQSIWKRMRKDGAYNAKECLMRNSQFRRDYLSDVLNDPKN